jgi:GTP cyclohydrolase II
MTGLSNIFRHETSLAADRAASELRAGRPVIIEATAGSIVVAALDGIAPSLFSIFRRLEGAALALSAQRAGLLGIDCDGPVIAPAAEMDLKTAKILATGTMNIPQIHAQPASTPVERAIGLCKYALLLPAAFVAPVKPGINLPPEIFRCVLDSLIFASSADPSNLEIISEAEVPLAGNQDARFVVFRGPAPRDQVAIIIGAPDPSVPVLVRVHSACLTGDLFGSLKCDCGDQLRAAMARLAAGGGGILIYLDQEGRGIGIGNKIRAYGLQTAGLDTIDADAHLGFEADERHYDYAAAILGKLGYSRIRLLTNNPEKIEALTQAGIEVVERVPVTGAITAENLDYLNTKAQRAGHRIEGLSPSTPISPRKLGGHRR